MNQRIAAHLEGQKQRIIEDIQALIRIESIYGNEEGNRNALGFVMQRAAEMGIPCEMTREEDVVLARIGSGGEKVGILVHVDVVEPGDLDKWTHPPFSGFFDGDTIWGRGALDDKGAVIVSLYLLKALLDLQVPLGKQVWLIVGSGEEGSDWKDICTHFRRDFGFPDYGFSPDGDFPIYNRENGYADVELDFSEPKRAELLELQAGESTNSIPSKAIVRFRDLPAMMYHGAAAHSSTPQLGENAIKLLAGAHRDRVEFNFIRFITDHLLADDHGSPLGLNPPEGSVPGIPNGHTICVPTVLDLTPGGVKLNVNVRHKHGISREMIQRQFAGRAGEYHYTLKLYHYHSPLWVPEEHPLLQLMKTVYEAHGFRNEFKIGSGTSYAKSMDHFISWGPNFPDTVNVAHMEDEHISMESLLTAARIYADFLVRCVTGPSLVVEEQ